MRMTAIAVTALLLTGSSNAQTSVPVTTGILIPVAVSGVDGHFGTRWVTEIWVYNDSDHDVPVDRVICTDLFGSRPCDPPPLYVPAKTAMRVPSRGRTGNQPYMVLRPPLADAPFLHVTAHLREESTDPGGAGMDIPIAFADDMRLLVSIPGIPTDVRYRALLRVYTRAARVRVRTHDAATGTLLDARSVTRPIISDGDNFGTVNVHDLLAIPEIRAVERVRVEVECNDPAWAMVTLTDNATQRVSVYAPSFHRYPSP